MQRPTPDQVFQELGYKELPESTDDNPTARADEERRIFLSQAPHIGAVPLAEVFQGWGTALGSLLDTLNLPQSAAERRYEVARASGVHPDVLAAYAAARRWLQPPEHEIEGGIRSRDQYPKTLRRLDGRLPVPLRQLRRHVRRLSELYLGPALRPQHTLEAVASPAGAWITEGDIVTFPFGSGRLQYTASYYNAINAYDWGLLLRFRDPALQRMYEQDIAYRVLTEYAREFVSLVKILTFHPGAQRNEHHEIVALGSGRDFELLCMGILNEHHPVARHGLLERDFVRKVDFSVIYDRDLWKYESSRPGLEVREREGRTEHIEHYDALTFGVQVTSSYSAEADAEKREALRRVQEKYREAVLLLSPRTIALDMLPGAIEATLLVERVRRALKLPPPPESPEDQHEWVDGASYEIQQRMNDAIKVLTSRTLRPPTVHHPMRSVPVPLRELLRQSLMEQAMRVGVAGATATRYRSPAPRERT